MPGNHQDKEPRRSLDAETEPTKTRTKPSPEVVGFDFLGVGRRGAVEEEDFVDLLPRSISRETGCSKPQGMLSAPTIPGLNSVDTGSIRAERARQLLFEPIFAESSSSKPHSTWIHSPRFG